MKKASRYINLGKGPYWESGLGKFDTRGYQRGDRVEILCCGYRGDAWRLATVLDKDRGGGPLIQIDGEDKNWLVDDYGCIRGT